ncbi:MAG: hypothetical protein K5984_02145 [Bacteroidales bacterium]|nr:hypothetical protein [Bacteroidales bacterium]
MNKLQELTDKLYNEGLAKGKEEGEALLASARKEASDTVEAAKKEAEAIVAKARKDAEDLKAKAESDIRTASAQSLQATKKDIENLFVGNLTENSVKAALSSEDFVKELIKAVAEKFSAEEASDLEIVLPENLKAGLKPFVETELSKSLNKGVEAKFSKKIAGGFTIGPKDGGWFISLTDETFKELIGEYLRPVTKKLLFGE